MPETLVKQPHQDVRSWAQSELGRAELNRILEAAEAAHQSFSQDTRVLSEMMREPVTVR